MKKLALVACLLVGLSMLAIACYLLAKDLYFAYRADAIEAHIIEVRKESVAKGKSSVLAYVPIVEVPGTNGTSRIAVETFSAQPVYKIGDRIAVLCDRSSSRCKRNSFVDRWGDFAVDFILSLVFLSVPLVYYWQAGSNRVRDADV